ncbi:MAG: cupin domain-containing protein [Jiangellaceae bacterium]
MTTDDQVRLITADQRRQGDPTPGMVREQAIAVEGMWAGLVRTDAHMTSGWHHHGDHDTAVFVVDGALRMAFGPDGNESLDAGAGDFVHVPKGVIHRESNPTDAESHVVVVRAGSGPPTINVDGPPPATGGA